MRAKAWLLEQGFIEKDGRGRISLENHKRLANSGLTFSDWPKGKVTEAVKGETPVVRVVRDKTVNVGTTEYRAPDEYRYPENLYRVERLDGVKDQTIGMRAACNNCGFSLCDHRCNEPMALGKAVRIVAL